MSTLTPGQIVQHPEHGYGIVYIDSTASMGVMHRSAKWRLSVVGTAGWGPVETLRPGHVQVRVDDLDRTAYEDHITAAKRLTAAWAAAAKPAQPDEPTSFGARVTVTNHKAETADLWARQHDGYWANEDGELLTWAALCERGEVRIGWDD